MDRTRTRIQLVQSCYRGGEFATVTSRNLSPWGGWNIVFDDGMTMAVMERSIVPDEDVDHEKDDGRSLGDLLTKLARHHGYFDPSQGA